MKGGLSASGYTIVEIMIFLAVSGALFVLAMITINGQQARAAFAQGTRDFQSSMQDLINDVQNGNFPENTNYTCVLGGSGQPQIGNGGGSNQGTHEDCVFLGKVIQFSPNRTALDVYTVVGRRSLPNNQEVTSYAQARPATAPTGQFNERLTIPGGLTVTDVISVDGVVSPNVGGVAFFNALTQYSNNQPTNDNLITVVPMLNATFTSPTETVATMTGKINSLGNAPGGADNFKDPQAVIICLSQGDVARRAALIIGGGGGHTTVDLSIGDIDTRVPNLAGGRRCPA